MVLLAVALLAPAAACAREYTKPSTPGYTKNPDGTWTFYSEKTIGPPGKEEFVRLWTDSAEKYAETQRRVVATAVDLGATGQTDSIVPGETSADTTVAKKLVETLRSKGSSIAGRLSSGLGKFMELLKTEPKANSVWGAIGAVTMGPAAFKLGVDIGNGIDELVGLPTWGGTPPEPTGGFRICGAKEPCLVGFKADTIVGGKDTTIEDCVKKTGLYSGSSGLSCPAEATAYEAYGETITGGGQAQFFYPPHSSCWQDAPPPTMVTSEGTNGPSCGVTVPVKIAFLEPGQLQTVGVPGPGLTGETPPAGSSTCALKKECKTGTLPTIGTPTIPSLAGDANGLGGKPVENREVIKEVRAADKSEPLEGKVVKEAGPEWIVPYIEKSKKETGTQYKERLEDLYDEVWEVEVKTLPESLIDPTVGPSGASYTVPGEGTVVVLGSKKIKVVVEQNPSTAPEPREAGEGGGESGGPTIPAIKWPSLPTPCNRFPFGIPCWLVERLGEFATSEETPRFEAHIDGKVMVIDFKVADKLMEIVRGVELVLGIIGAVLLFGRFASSSTGSSGGGD